MRKFDFSIGDKFSKRLFKKSAIISTPKDKDNVYIISKGKVELDEIHNDHKFIHSILRKGEIFGDFGFDIYPPVFTLALENTEITIIKTSQLAEILSQNKKYLFNLLNYFYIKLLIAQEKTVSMAFDDVSTRLIILLWQLSKPTSLSSDKYKTDKFTHQQLAHMLGVSRQTVTVTINNLKEKGLIKNHSKLFTFNKEILTKKAERTFDEIDKIQLKLERFK